MRLLVCLFVLSLISETDKGEPISVHVKEVHRTQDEGTDKGTWFHIIAVVETKAVVYNLKCDEFLSLEKRDFVVRCFNISAGKDYPARKFPKSISFWQPEDKVEGQTLVLYEIADEKEK
jgi:hypothetical protein